ncbi:DUF3095 domain-containing protein [Endozoicomonas sp. SM1973]|uniref:DUF3095 domain-containing protein n=1 Tax=Spartinivicinus marinus TaxID=2994442 RepID=A0A853I4T7_9GAMM|nr:DUF3095 domain-containing protein [Spartinivicinus marinus]MCX4028175.1 DUF3095 domain-containing protein [Spartinivicinus marinus]NYZ68373.1 DUF3095 domain-containing protein [Spartinivicinus marinus]
MQSESQHHDLTFYQNLPTFTTFSAFINAQHFAPAPDNWLIVISDVVHSSKAVANGRYKEVNMVGASCITSVRNALPNCEFPFVFGGDGATMLVPAIYKNIVEQSLMGTKQLAEQTFQLQLRVGIVPISAVRKQGKDVLVAKFELSNGNQLAMFNGGGVELADRLIKADINAQQYALNQTDSVTAPDLTGLSCRWESLTPRNDHMLCILVQPLFSDIEQREQVFQTIIPRLMKITGQDFQLTKPVTQANLQFKWPPQGIILEAKISKGTKPYWQRYLYLLFNSFIQAILNKCNLSAGSYNAPVYRNQLCDNADYRRFDDSLRLVLDCTNEQTTQIKQLLEEQYQQGQLVYGIHQANQALMTCMVSSLENSQHLHFIDGSGGGFWAASVRLKNQLKNHQKD